MTNSSLLTAPTNLAILGTGDVAQAFARGLIAMGHAVMLAGRDSNETSQRLAAFAVETGVRTGNYAQAAAFGAAVFLAVKGLAAEAVLHAAGPALDGKLLVDATNPIADEAPDHGVLRFFTERNESLGERLQSAFPAVKLVKAFNTVGAAHFVRPSFAQGAGSMFVAGNDPEAKQAVVGLVEAWGWQPYDVGRIEGARTTEPLCQLWCLPGFLRNDWAHALKVIV